MDAVIIVPVRRFRTDWTGLCLAGTVIISLQYPTLYELI